MRKTIVYRLMTPVRYFINDSRSTGVMLIVCTIVSLLVSNAFSSGGNYRFFWQKEIHYPFTSVHLPHSVVDWVNNFLMGIFFVLAGTEIKRELTAGELSSFKKAVLPFGAALGGMLVPALLFVSFNAEHTQFIRGWGIPTATDIAFSLGIASLLGKKVPLNIKMLLMALAIIDDLGAIVVIALFYGSKISWLFLAAAAVVYAALLACNYFKLKFGVVQVVLGLLLWYFVLQSGIEASISGVLFAFAVPVKQLAIVEKYIHYPVNFFILPLFALANTAVLIPPDIGGAIQSPVGLGVTIGLVAGKPLGIFFVCSILVSLGIARLPTNVNWRQILGMGMLAGIGFTMSIFTTTLAFNDALARDTALVAIIISVCLSSILSMAYFSGMHRESVMHKNRKLPTIKMQPELAASD